MEVVMLRHIWPGISFLALVGLPVGFSAPSANAQSVASASGESAAVAGRPLVVSIAASPMGLDDSQRSNGPAIVGSVQIGVGRLLVVEGEATRWAANDRHRDVRTIGTNLLVRGGTPQVSAFIGGGIGVRFARGDDLVTSSSIERRTTTLARQFVTGLDVWVAPTLAAFSTVRAGFSADDLRPTSGISALVGLRLALRTSAALRSPVDPASALGKEVRVTLMDGSTWQGRLISFSSSEVVIPQQSIPLGIVSKVEKVSHALRRGLLIGIGTAAGSVFVIGPLADLPGDMLLGLVATSVGSGVAIGGFLAASSAKFNTIYVAPGATASITVKPILSRQQQGVAFAMRW
jgi:hypothetical protein